MPSSSLSNLDRCGPTPFKNSIDVSKKFAIHYSMWAKCNYYSRFALIIRLGCWQESNYGEERGTSIRINQTNTYFQSRVLSICIMSIFIYSIAGANESFLVDVRKYKAPLKKLSVESVVKN